VVVRGEKPAFGARTFSTFYAQPTPTLRAGVWGSKRVLGVSPEGSVGAACVCWVVWKFGGKVYWACLKKQTAELDGARTQKSWAIGNDPPPLYAHIPPARFSKPRPLAPPPDPRLKAGPVFVASGGVMKCPSVRAASGVGVGSIKVGLASCCGCPRGCRHSPLSPP